ncbi:ClbS/DfsB family four-helix bundle protein [Cryobacterium sp. N22]|uniref:ClbS/DfsB family four-helix bundle protein n=1 Tax=Cryobacterium sp. N22 TaxID=2048290 RepID=UPI001E45B60E|nr:ClbS/DfsB family four-helix bundle protein [Cryobacterium sp. N22]
MPVSKADLLLAIETTFSSLNTDLDRVPPELAREPVLAGHAKNTTMSPADLVAYLIGWNEQVLLWHERRSASLPDEFPAAGAAWNELGALAQRYYSEHRDESWSELRSRLARANQAVVALVDGYSDDELYGRAWYGTYTMGRMISLNTSSPYLNARGRIRAWLRTL